MNASVCRRWCLLVSWILAGSAWAGPNIFPDPGFESRGDAAAARTGKKCGILRVGAQQEHWRALGGNLSVEPFATYRATGWAKGKAENGTLYALYSYGWNSYGWGFMSSARVPKGDEWKQVSTTFVVPVATVTFHPLAAGGARNAVACVDDVTVERIKSPEQTIADIEKSGSHAPNDLQLLARYYLGQGDTKRVREIMVMGDQTTKADIACLFAQRAKTIEERRRWIVEMVRQGCMRLPDAKLRLRELTEDMSEMDRLSLCTEALEAANGADHAAKAVERIMSAKDSGELLPVAEAEALLKQRADLLANAIADAKDKPAVAKALASLQEGVAKQQAKLAERKASLGSLRLVINGNQVAANTYQIVVPNEPTPSEEHAAKELQFHLEAMTGQWLEVVRATDAGGRFPIILGKNELLGKRGLLVDFPSLGLDGILIRTDGPALVLAGNRRGVLYAVYTFLEEQCGCRWFTADCQRIPKSGTVRVTNYRKRYLPPFEYRDTDYPNCRPPEFGVRNKLNGMCSRADATWGGHYKYRGFVHTFRYLVPPEKYFAEHPEYYSEIKGVRVGPDRTQLCLTNPDVLRIATETVKRWIEESPQSKIISVSQNDWHNYCECPTCQALAEKEGSQAGPLLHFVNGIADAVRDEHPDVIIDTLAYQYTRKPPKFVKPRPNVAVRLCSIECCFVHPLASCPKNESFVKDIEGWNAICDRLYIWDYVINYAHCIQPFPNLYVIKPNIEFFRDHGVKGMYEEANYFSKGGELAELRTYLMAKTLWDPSYDTDRAIDEFVAGYYGPAGKYVRRYIDLIHQNICSNTERHVRIYSAPNSYLNDPDMLAKAEALFDQAEAAVAGDETLSHRVQVARLPILYTRIALGGSRYRQQDDGLVTDAADAGLADRFEKIARAEGVTHVREGQRGYFDSWITGVKQRNRPVKLLTLKSKGLVAQVIPELGGRIWSLKELAGGTELLKKFGNDKEGWQPSEGGYEEYSTTGYRGPGWSEEYRVAKQDEHSVELQCALPNGFVMDRTIQLVPDQTELVVTSTLRNATKGTKKAQFRTHPAFAVSATADAEAFLKQRDGTWVVKPLANPEDPQAEKELWLRGDACPAGAWGVFDKKTGVGVLNTFSEKQVAFCYLNWNGKQGRVNLEQWSTPGNLKPGQSLVLRNSYRVIHALPENAK
jgi:galactose mutarotase-like enzyme